MIRARLAVITRWPWYPTGIGLVIVTRVFTEGPIELAAGLRPALVAICGGVILTGVWCLLLDRDRGGVAAALTVAGMVAADTALKVAPVAAAILLLVVERITSEGGTRRLVVPWPRVTSSVNTLIGVFLLILLAQGLLIRLEVAPLPASADWTASASGGPDVFVILADGHARLDVLESRFGLDTATFRHELAAAGMTESPDSWANHTGTRYSLSVLLNGRPLSELGQDLSQAADHDLPYRALPGNSVMRLFHDSGYETVVVASGWEHLSLRGADRYVDVGPRNEVEQALISTTAVGSLVDAAGQGVAHSARERFFGELEAIRSIAREDAPLPQFVFAHLPMPHFPMAVNADCSSRPQDAYTWGAPGRGFHAGDAAAETALRGQTRCVDALLPGLVADVAAARPDAIIVLLSDHGVEELLDWWNPDLPGSGIDSRTCSGGGRPADRCSGIASRSQTSFPSLPMPTSGRRCRFTRMTCTSGLRRPSTQPPTCCCSPHSRPAN